MKSELRIERTAAGFVIKGILAPLSRARTPGGGDVDLSERADMVAVETQYGPPYVTEAAARRALEKLQRRNAR